MTHATIAAAKDNRQKSFAAAGVSVSRQAHAVPSRRQRRILPHRAVLFMPVHRPETRRRINLVLPLPLAGPDMAQLQTCLTGALLVCDSSRRRRGRGRPRFFDMFYRGPLWRLKGWVSGPGIVCVGSRRPTRSDDCWVLHMLAFFAFCTMCRQLQQVFRRAAVVLGRLL